MSRGAESYAVVDQECLSSGVHGRPVAHCGYGSRKHGIHVLLELDHDPIAVAVPAMPDGEPTQGERMREGRFDTSGVIDVAAPVAERALVDPVGDRVVGRSLGCAHQFPLRGEHDRRVDGDSSEDDDDQDRGRHEHQDAAPLGPRARSPGQKPQRLSGGSPLANGSMISAWRPVTVKPCPKPPMNGRRWRARCTRPGRPPARIARTWVVVRQAAAAGSRP